MVDGERQRFTSGILPPYLRRSPKVTEVLPVLYLRGLSTGDFQEALPGNARLTESTGAPFGLPRQEEVHGGQARHGEVHSSRWYRPTHGLDGAGYWLHTTRATTWSYAP